jgi:hypothetical protein
MRTMERPWRLPVAEPRFDVDDNILELAEQSVNRGAFIETPPIAMA